MKAEDEKVKIVKKIALVFVVALVVAAAGLILAGLAKKSEQGQGKIIGIFSSQEEFKNYLTKSAEITQFREAGGGWGTAADMALKAPENAQTATVERVSETNIQVTGVDEPDIVKTDGNNIYLAQENGPWLREVSWPSVRPTNEIKIIEAFPVDQIKETAKIEESGNLLLEQKTLVILANEKIAGYDVSRADNPQKIWEMEYEESWLETARLYQNKIYLILKKSINRNEPCPIPLLKGEGREIMAACNEVYYPITPVAVETTYSILRINPDDGKVEEKLTLVGSINSSVIYVSEGAIYLTYLETPDYAEQYLKFFRQEGEGLLPNDLLTKVEKLTQYEISEQSKLNEIQLIIGQFTNSLEKDERLKFENELHNKQTSYAKRNLREMEKTGITKIGLVEMKIEAAGKIPGRLLSQFSLDENKNYLRAAVTVGAGLWGGAETENDVYVLDKNLKISGGVTGLGAGERIYAARFIGERGYVVTFRETDPFYVLDLSNPDNPKKCGELKIPGYSSYLHPINEKRILGVGKEEQSVKLSLFDVSRCAEAIELDTYILDEYWTEVTQTHHAFLHDAQHKVFFIPGGKGGYVFSYQNDKLEMIRAVSGEMVKRAVFINNYFYVIGEGRIVVLNEENWEVVKELNL